MNTRNITTQKRTLHQNGKDKEVYLDMYHEVYVMSWSGSKPNDPILVPIWYTCSSWTVFKTKEECTEYYKA